METSSENLIMEWRRIDPILEDLEGFQQFCEIRVAGGDYPLNEEDIFLRVEPPRRDWSLDRFPASPINCIEYSMLRDCIPRETADDYWERNNKAAGAVMKVVAHFLGQDPQVDWKPKDGLSIPLHINDSRQHIEWVKDTFGFSLSKEDFEDAWKLFERKEWFDQGGYYVRGWLTVAEALGIGQAARKALETTQYPHADSPQVKEQRLCDHMRICPIYHYREWLRVMHIDIPEDVFNYDLFQSNCCYYIRRIKEDWFKQGRKDQVLKVINDPNLSFKVKWKIRKMIRDYMTYPRCRNCGEISYYPDRFPNLELCWKCQKLLYKVYRTRINPLAGEYGIPPKHVETVLRQRLIEGDPILDDVED